MEDDPNLKINDEFVLRIGKGAYPRACWIETNFTKYISILESIQSKAIQKGEIAETLNEYISCAKRLKGQISKISKDIEDICKAFLFDIDEADKYIF